MQTSCNSRLELANGLQLFIWVSMWLGISRSRVLRNSPGLVGGNPPTRWGAPGDELVRKLTSAVSIS